MDLVLLGLLGLSPLAKTTLLHSSRGINLTGLQEEIYPTGSGLNADIFGLYIHRTLIRIPQTSPWQPAVLCYPTLTPCAPHPQESLPSIGFFHHLKDEILLQGDMGTGPGSSEKRHKIRGNGER